MFVTVNSSVMGCQNNCLIVVASHWVDGVNGWLCGQCCQLHKHIATSAL